MKKKLLYLFPNFAEWRSADVERGLLPSERLYGAFELRQRGWDVLISDSRWYGPMSKLRLKYKRIFEIPSLSTMQDMRSSDIVVIKDDFSITLLMEAMLVNKPVVYLDAMFELPCTLRRRRAVAYNLKRAKAVCCYSKLQADQWAEAFGIPFTRFTILPYCIDSDFYPEVVRQPADPPYVLAIGRDLGRDYGTLVQACDQLGIDLKLITLPYLVPKQTTDYASIEILQNITYSQLFALYSKARMTVIPLKANITYPSGIRNLLESAALGVPTIVSSTLVLPEYLQHEEHVLYTIPENIPSLVYMMRWTLHNFLLAEDMAARAANKVHNNYTMNRFADILEGIIQEI